MLVYLKYVHKIFDKLKKTGVSSFAFNYNKMMDLKEFGEVDDGTLLTFGMYLR